jgi:16S rRNA (cytosine967-C5)-methyltransferase
MHLYSYLNSAKEIIKLYEGNIPFAAWLKEYFRQHKKFGSRDRKAVSSLCFSYFRIGAAFNDKTIDEKLLIGQFLCNDSSPFIDEYKPEWKELIHQPVNEKLSLIGHDNIFSFVEELSNEIDQELLDLSFLIQPDLFLRIRPGNRNKVLDKLDKAGAQYIIEGENTVRLPNSYKAEEILAIDKEVVIQDLNSQQVLLPLILETKKHALGKEVWDCCAASGGKSILFYDSFPNISITASDIRESIIRNLRNRFKNAGISNYQSFVADIAAKDFSLKRKYDIVICDAPCSGSGTWSRTPEQLIFFRKENIDYYADLQKSIAINAAKAVRENGYFLYITCSVFKRENEAVMEYIKEETGMTLCSNQYLKGYTEKADTLFTALFKRL